MQRHTYFEMRHDLTCNDGTIQEDLLSLKVDPVVALCHIQCASSVLQWKCSESKQ